MILHFVVSRLRIRICIPIFMDWQDDCEPQRAECSKCLATPSRHTDWQLFINFRHFTCIHVSLCACSCACAGVLVGSLDNQWLSERRWCQIGQPPTMAKLLRPITA
eukprot:gnl/MRDRNA2_/MRDRNA2_86287_c0_seq1.p1 gnl/MRDRNA2_/MRDRNA2_86287_c0~~gnl/MRDRNA2_/MRDRNA2_86287_c0_seq1.p1  ORF type:complete len:106 (+),score=10.58 gnl/MRDRNA2_/MRDRNA2_86287_c0_seq1:64-381(+)